MMRLRSIPLTTLALLPLLLAGCKVLGPNYKVPKEAVIERPDANAAFLGASEKPFSSEALPQQWWRLYNDATLDGLIEKALATNTDLRVAAANLARAHTLVEEVEDLGKPEVSASFAPSWTQLSAPSLGQGGKFPVMGVYDIGAAVSYQLDMWGQIKRGVEAAQADVGAAQAAIDVTRVTIVADTTRAYAEACSAGHEIHIAEESVAVQQKFVRATAQRVKLGRGNALENSRAQEQLERLRAAIPPFEAKRRAALYRLAVLAGETPSNFPQALAQCKKAPQLMAAIPVGDGAALLRRRPDIRQAERGLAAATARIGVATAELYPSIRLGASLGSTGMTSAFGAGNAFRYSLGPLISWNLPFTGAAHIHVERAEVETRTALARFDGVVLNALRETETALSNYARELDRNAALTAARDQSGVATAQTEKLYKYGRTDFLSTLDAERAHAASEAALAESQAKLVQDQVNLFLALGGGWEPSEQEQAAAAETAQHAGHGEPAEKAAHAKK